MDRIDRKKLNVLKEMNPYNQVYKDSSRISEEERVISAYHEKEIIPGCEWICCH